MGENTFLFLCEVVGTFAFAISGIRKAANKNFDLFGAYVVGITTAIGGGTIRDAILGVPPFWFSTPTYVIITALAIVAVMIFGGKILMMNNTFFIFDTIGLSLFTVVGIEKTLYLGHPIWVAIIMGTITGAFGGILRDVLTRDIPLIFHKDIYALACVLGGLVYWLVSELGANDIVTPLLAAIVIFLVRVGAVRFHWSLPRLKPLEGEDKE